MKRRSFLQMLSVAVPAAKVVEIMPETPAPTTVLPVKEATLVMPKGPVFYYYGFTWPEPLTDPLQNSLPFDPPIEPPDEDW